MKCKLIILCSFLCLHAHSQNQNIQQFLSLEGEGNISLGLYVQNLATGEEVASFNENLPLTPASTLKILTTSTALDMLGEDFRFKTTLSIDKNDKQHLIIHGYGDPTLGSEYASNNPQGFLDQWADQILKVIDTTQPIKITIVDSYFGYAGVSPKWIQEDLGNYFAAGAYGISVFDNTYRLYFNTTKVDDCPHIVKMQPNIKEMSFFNVLRTNGKSEDNGFINGVPSSNSRKLVGNIPAGRTSFILKGDIPNPGLFLGQSIAAKLREKGIVVDEVETSKEYYYQQFYLATKNRPQYKEEIFYTHWSIPLKDIVKIINVRSNNHYAEHLIRAVGRLSSQNIYDDPLETGISNMKQYWSAKGINVSDMFIYDGCGLAPSDKISAKSLCDILSYMQMKSSEKGAFLASFPKAGKSGTVKNFLKGTRLEGRLSVKSGSIAHVQCFAGYYQNEGKEYAFALLVNNYNSPRKEVVKAIEHLLLTIF